VARSGRGRLGGIEKDKRGLMFGGAAARRAAVRMQCPRFTPASPHLCSGLANKKEPEIPLRLFLTTRSQTRPR